MALGWLLLMRNVLLILCYFLREGTVEAFPVRPLSPSYLQLRWKTALRGTFLEDFLADYGWDDRLISLSSGTLPLMAEIQCDGRTQVGKLVELDFSGGNPEKPPKLIVELCVESSMQLSKIDIGQLTTVWSTTRQPTDLLQLEEKVAGLDPIPLPQIEEALDELYSKARPIPGRQGKWTKRKLQQRIDQVPLSCSFEEKAILESTIRQVAKAGQNHKRLVDSDFMIRFLPKQKMTILQKAQAAKILGNSVEGRFKRFPCIPIDVDAAAGTLVIVNGGWMAVDSAVKASQEAKALAETGTSRGTNADERIIQRLEHLAMSGQGDSVQTKEDLQLDVRQLLKAMDLPCSSEGGKKALVIMGLWSDDIEELGFKPQPWSPEVLEAVAWYQAMDEKRKARIGQTLNSKKFKKNEIEGRTDLTRLPCVCIDAARTTFRDDAIGVRPRSSTGRKVSGGSKWEILLHTVDVSDLYSPQIAERSKQLQLLQTVARKRGSSRYDLPSGPLHLLPPTLLETLALRVSKSLDKKLQSSLVFNRCVTLWLYIDEKSGKLLDAGLERTIIAAPVALTFAQATEMLDDKGEMNKAQTILKLVERNLSLWKERRQKTSSSARARENRLEAREEVDKIIYGNLTGDDGRDGFRRTRGHHLIDLCLDVYSLAIKGLMKRNGATFPYVAGAGRDGRVATAPLRRFIDGMAQRQALAALCDYGGDPLSKDECVEIGKDATKAINAIKNIRSSKSSPVFLKGSSKIQRQQRAARVLLHSLETAKNNSYLAMSTGKQSEVVLLDFGAVASCSGIHGTLKPGEKIKVTIRDIDPFGRIKVTFDGSQQQNRNQLGARRKRI